MRRNILQAGRLRGDIDLGTDLSRLNGASVRDYARMDFPGGLLSGQTEQALYEESATQKYNIGTRRVHYDRTFRYSYAGAALAGLGRLVINSNFAPGVTGHTQEDGYEGSLQTQAEIGDLYVDIADTVVRVADYYRGGHIVAFGGTVFHNYYIVKSDVGTGVYVRCYLDAAVYEQLITTGYGVTAYLSKYSDIRPATGAQTSFESFVGLNIIPIDSAGWFWMQTRGPAWVTPTGGTWPGSAANLRDIYANPGDGTIQPPTLSDPSAGYQRIGYLIGATGGTGSDYGDALIQLMLE